MQDLWRFFYSSAAITEYRTFWFFFGRENVKIELFLLILVFSVNFTYFGTIASGNDQCLMGTVTKMLRLITYFFLVVIRTFSNDFWRNKLQDRGFLVIWNFCDLLVQSDGSKYWNWGRFSVTITRKLQCIAHYVLVAMTTFWSFSQTWN